MNVAIIIAYWPTWNPYLDQDLKARINSYKLKGWKIPPKKIIKRPDQIDGIRESGLVNIAVLDYVAENTK